MNLLKKTPATLLVIAAIVSINLGAGFGKALFAQLAPLGVVWLRIFFGALILLLATRPDFRAFSIKQWKAALVFGIVLGSMNAFFYLSLSRLPIGVAVTIEFLGPLSVALWHSRRALDWVWVLLAAAGVAMFHPQATGIDSLGVVYALLAGACWAAYIVLGEKLGRLFSGAQGVALPMLIAALLLLPLCGLSAWPASQKPALLLVALAVGLLSSAIPYTLEIEALRRLPTRLFGILMSLEPAMAALIGLLVLGEHLSVLQVLAIAAVMLASFGAARYSATPVV